jgi:hypothetical protein
VKGRWLAIGGMGATLVAPYLILQFAPEAEFGQSICPHKLLTGLPCPGCGITRSIMALYRGDLSGSLAYHVFGIPLVIACVIGITTLGIEMGTGRRFSRALLFDMRVARAAAVLFGGYHVVRLWQFVSSHDFDGILRESIWR